jgi:protein ImuB
MERVACIHFPFWPIQWRIARQPELRFQRIVLEVRHPQRGLVVAGASPLALRCGVRVGMPLVEAKSLLRKRGGDKSYRKEKGRGERDDLLDTGEFYVLAHEPGVDRVELEQLARQLDSFSPLVGLDTTEPPGALLLDVTGLAPLFSGEDRWLERLLETLTQWGYVARGAIAATVGAAWALAHSPPPANNNSATDNSATGRITGEFSWELLDALPPAALRIEADVCETLAQLGLTTIGALRRIPPDSLATRFGDQIGRRLRQAAGEIRETFRSVSAEVPHRIEQRLDFPVHDHDVLLAAIAGMIAEVCRGLASEGQGAMGWQLRLTKPDAPPLDLRVGLCQATAQPNRVMPLIQMQLEQQAGWGGELAGIEQIAVAALGCVRLSERQGDLFDDQPRKHETARGELLNRLAIRLGEDNVLSAVCVAGAQPERAVEYRPLVGPRAVTPRRTKPVSDGDLLRRPVRLLPQPLELSVSAWAGGAGQAGWGGTAPAEFAVAGERYPLIRWWGPERIETGWWYGRTIRRDYWRVETTSRAQFWIFQDLRTRHWFLHGSF